MSRLAQSPHLNSSSTRRRRLESSRRSKSLLPLIEALEDRRVLSTITWNTTAAPTGGDWDTATNWNGNVIPGPNDNAVISLTSSGTVTHLTATSDSVKSLTTNANTALNIESGSIALGSGTSTLYSTTVGSGATLSVGANASVTIGPTSTNGGTATFADNGTVSFAAGDVVTVNATTYYGTTTQVVVGSGGLLAATSTTFNSAYANNGTTLLVVNSGGHLQASSSSFALSQVYLNIGTMLNAGDLVGDGFDSPLYIPAIDVQYLSGANSNNLRFQSIYIVPDTLLNGQSVALNLIGTQNTTNLRYIFPNNFTVSQGATLSVGPNVPVTIGPTSTNGGTATFADNGTVSFAAGDVVTVNATTYYGTTTQVVVGSGGLLAATSTTFNSAYANNGTTLLVVNSGGHLQASSSSFALSQVYLNIGTMLNAGDLVGDGFDSPLYIPAIDVQYLSGTNSNNLRFQSIYIIPDTLLNGQSVALNLIGTQNTTNLRYIFPNNFTVSQGATLSVGPNVPVTIGPTSTNGGTATFADNGTVSFAAGDVVTVNATTYYGTTTQVVVGSGGLLAATSTTFNSAYANNGTTLLVVNSGGHLQASSSSFALSQVYLNIGTMLNAGDLVGDGFDSPLYIPAIDVQYLSGTNSNNLRFQSIYIIPDTLLNGQSVALNLIGTQNTTNLRYIFPNNFTVNQGATLAVGPNVPVTIGPTSTNGGTATFADNGTVSFAAGDVVTVNATTYYGTTTQVVVGSGGLLNASSTTFNSAYANNGTTLLVVNSGGQFNAISSSIALTSVTLNQNSTDVLGSDPFSGVLTIDSAAIINIHGNDFSNVGSNGVVAVGDPNATIDLTANYWGTQNATQIQAKILDHYTNPTTRPTVNFGSFLGSSPLSVSITGTVFNDVNGDGVQDNGEVGLAGVTVYLDANNTGSFVSTDTSTTTNSLGQYRFDGQPAGNYVVRELAPLGTVNTSPSPSPVSTPITFDGTGGESGITTAGTSSFSYHGASFSGGAVFLPSQSGLLASGTQAYNSSSNPSQVLFSQPVTTANFFYVHGFGYAAGTATAYAIDGSVIGTANSNPATLMGAPGNFVTLTGSKPIARITFLGGVVDNFTFTTAASNQAYFVELAAGQTASGNNFGDQYGPVALEVQSLTPTTTGFAVTFNAAVNTSVLNLYDAGGQYGSPDVTLVGQNTGPVTGSLVVSPDGKTVTFVRTAGVLVPDTYTLTLVSGANAFKTTVNSGGYLDGIGNGVPGSNLVTTFTVAQPASNAVVVSIPSFARGYGQPVNIPAPTTNGLPITLSTGLNVSAVDLTLHYNPALLTLTGFTTSIAGAVANANLSTPGLAILTVSSTTAFSTIAGAIPLGTFTATVPNTAPYGSKEVLDLTNLAVFDASTQAAPLPSLGQDGVHVAAFFGDTNGDGAYTTQDVTLEQRLIVNTNTGFAFFKQTDPVLLGDISGNGQVQGNDTTLIQRAIGQIPSPNIPALPTGIAPPPSGGPDPTLFIPNLEGKQGDVVTVPVRLTVGESAGITLSSFEVAISYDPSRFSVDPSMPIGSTFGALGSTFVTFPAPGEIIVQASSPGGTATIPYGTTADLFDMTFSVLPGAAYGPTVINLLQNIATTTTGLFANDANVTSLTLSPAPSDQATDSVDGTFTVGTLTVTSAPVTTTGVTVAFNQPFSLAPLNLYDTATAGFGPADLTLVGATTGPVQGSLIVNPGNQSLSFVKTGGVLAPDTYTLTLRSAANGFTDAYGGLLDGNADGTTGDNYTTTFTVAPASARVVALPDFARGPGQAVVIPAASGSGLPLTISDGTSVTSIGLSLTYNPSLLTITGANLGPSAPAGSSVTIDTSTPGTALLTFTSPTALPAGPGTFATLVATVPASAPYASKEALVISNLVVDGGSIAAIDQDGVHAVAYLGDTTGNGGYSSFDATLVRQVVANISTGFAAYPLLDPRIVGDIAGFGTLSGIDATYITQYVANLPQPRIPALPNVTIVSGGPDPLIWLPQDVTASPGATVSVPVLFRQTNGSAIGLASAALAIEFDPGVFEVTGIRLGGVAPGFTLDASYDDATGEIIATERSATGAIVLAPGTQGTLLYVDFLVRPGAPSGSSRINLLGEGRVGSSVLYTALNDGGLTLVPAPTDSDLDPTDGVATITAPTTLQPTTMPVAGTSPGGPATTASLSQPAIPPVIAPQGVAPNVSSPVAPATLLGSTLVAAGPPEAIDRAVEASHGKGLHAGRAAVLNPPPDDSTHGDSTLGELIPWTPSDSSAVWAGSEESVIVPIRRKSGVGQALLAMATPDSVGLRR